MEELKVIFDAFESQRVMVIGDLMLDSYYHGKVERISPEAPVPVVSVDRKEYRLGGAANVALNLQALGAQVDLCGIVGADADAAILKSLLVENQLNTQGIIAEQTRRTTVKTRIIGNKHQVLRVDSEDTFDIQTQTIDLILSYIKKSLPFCQALIIEDYNKGMLTAALIKEIIAFAIENHIPVVVDPKLNNFFEYKHVTLFKPNKKEVKDGLKTDLNLDNPDSVLLAIKELQNKLQCEWVMITLSEHGVMIGNQNEHYYLPAHERKIADVSGAGDTVISVAALCIALKLPAKTIAAMSNLAGGLVCEKPGVVPIDRDVLFKEFQALSSK